MNPPLRRRWSGAGGSRAGTALWVGLRQRYYDFIHVKTFRSLWESHINNIHTQLLHWAYLEELRSFSIGQKNQGAARSGAAGTRRKNKTTEVSPRLVVHNPRKLGQSAGSAAAGGGGGRVVAADA